MIPKGLPDPALGERIAPLRPEGAPAILGAVLDGGRLRLAAGPRVPGGLDAELDDAVRLASVSKIHTAALCLQLAAERALDLDAPPPPLARRGWEDATFRACLAHRAGLPDHFADPAFLDRLRVEHARRWRGAELLGAALDGVVPRPPGTFAYSDAGYVAVALAVEEALGVPFREALRTCLLDPLGLVATWLEPHEPPLRPAVHHADGALDLTTIDPSFDWGGGGLVAPLRDAVAFFAALLGGRVLPGPVLAELLAFGPAPSATPNIDYDGYGLGIGRRSAAGLPFSATRAPGAPSPGWWRARAGRSPAA